ncbi:kinase-like domain-containing protein [Nemania sp. FL0031]|nr:kinase-like domain-containing protein [Nemania sp. FL0031]
MQSLHDGTCASSIATPTTGNVTVYSSQEKSPHTAGRRVWRDVLEKYETNDVTYEFTATAFKKTSRLPQAMERVDGIPFIWKRSWNHERIANEVNALRLVSQQTTIPVPRIIDHGTNPDGTQYLITELISGIPLDQLLDMGCSLPEGKKHTPDKPCESCVDEGYSNALEFIEGSVLPQLTKLKSRERGILGFVMPPHWLPIDVDPPWKGKGPWKTLRLEEPKYVFQHGDLAAHNILIDPQTLQVKALIDWEYAGFFPPGMERWPGTLDKYVYIHSCDDVADAIAKFLSEEYLECYHQWEDKAQLASLVENGKLPDPEKLEKTRWTT